jgi:hypothetical protein
VLDRISFDGPRSDRPGLGKVPPGVASVSHSPATAPDRTFPPVAQDQPAPTPLAAGGPDTAASAAPGNSAVEHAHGPHHPKQLPAAAAHGQETAAAAKQKEKGKSVAASGHSGKSTAAPGAPAASHPSHPEHPAKPSHPEASEPAEPSPPPAAVPTEPESAPPAEAATDEAEPPVAPPGERKGKT